MAVVSQSVKCHVIYRVWRRSNLVLLELTCAVDFCWTLHPLPSSPTSRPEAWIGLTLFPPSIVWACVKIWSWPWHQNRVLVNQDKVALFLLQRCKAYPPGSVYLSLFWWSYCVVRTVGQYCVCVCVAHQLMYVVWCSVQVNMWHRILCMWCAAVYRLIYGTPAYVYGVVYILHTLAVFPPLCKAVNILSWHSSTVLCCFFITGTYTLHASTSMVV
jgi:hypothetical protein